MHVLELAASAGFNPLDARSLIQTFGLIGVLAVLFAETGLMLGFFLPGDSLLFLAGIAASPVATEIVGTELPLPVLLVGAPVCAIAGAQLGHFLGARYGTRLASGPGARFIKPEYTQRAEQYFVRYGPAKATVLARFVPIVRTFLNPIAGMLHMPAGRFFLWNVIGGILWTDGLILVGALGARSLVDAIGADNIDHYLLPVVVLIVLLSLIPIFVEMLRNRRSRPAEAAGHHVAS